LQVLARAEIENRQNTANKSPIYLGARIVQFPPGGNSAFSLPNESFGGPFFGDVSICRTVT
jgi:hypothetical protein